MNNAITDAELQLLANNISTDGNPVPIFNIHIYDDVDEKALLQVGQNEIYTIEGLKAVLYFKVEGIEVLWQLAYDEETPTEVFILEYVTKTKAYPNGEAVFCVKGESDDSKEYQKALMQDIVIPFAYRVIDLGAEKVETWQYNCVEEVKRG